MWKTNVSFGMVVLLTAGLLLLAVLACGEKSSTPNSESASSEAPPPTPVPPPTFSPGIQTPTDFGYNTRVVDEDIHVWHAPHCPPVPPAEFVASVILTDLGSGSIIYLDPDGSIRTSPGPVYHSDEDQERFAAVLDDNSLMELILTPFECP